MNKGRLIGCAALVGSAFLWATAYIAVKQIVEDVPPGLLLAFRFTLAALILAAICIPKFKLMSKDLLFSGVKMGIAMFFEFFLFTAGLQFTSASKSSFIIASYIILLPIAYLIIRRKKPTGSDVLASVICMVGVCLLLANGLTALNKGDLLCAGCAVAYAVHIVYSSKYSKQYDGWLLNLVQMGTVAVMAWIVTLISGDFRMIGSDPLPWGAFFFLAIVCSIAPYFLCLYGMKRVSTTTSGILLSFESVFATLLAVLMLGDPVYWQLVAGGIVIVGSSFVSEIFSNRAGKKKINVVNGFSDQPNGGNPAGVVYLEHGASLTEEQMQQIATKLHFSETAYIKRLSEDRFSIRYFTPAAEVPLCGHATIASFSYLHQKGVIGDGTYQLVTIEAELTVEVTEGIVWMEMDKPMMEQALDSDMVERICQAYEITPSDLAEGLEVRIVKSGLRDIHVCVKNKDVLMGAVQHEDQVSEISKELDVVGVHMSCLNEISQPEKSPTTDQRITAYCSNYAPYYDIPEECATGTSNGGLTYYLFNKGLILPEQTNCFLQGEHMNRPSKVYTKVRMEADVPTIWVGGSGVICEENVGL